MKTIPVYTGVSAAFQKRSTFTMKRNTGVFKLKWHFRNSIFNLVNAGVVKTIHRKSYAI